jgi:hypothetical protein
MKRIAGQGFGAAFGAALDAQDAIDLSAPSKYHMSAISAVV